VIWLDRRLVDGVKNELVHGAYRFLPAIVRAQSSPGTLDLRFRSRGKAGEATLYLGERAALRLRVAATGAVSVTGPAANVAQISPEGRVEAAYASLPENVVLDRQVAFRFSSQSEKDTVLAAVRTPVEATVNALSATYPWPAPPILGQEIDAIAVAKDGSLAIVEIKAGSDVGGIGWAPAQVAMYAALVRHWIATSTDPANVLTSMLQDRASLGLADQRAFSSPLHVLPVVAVGLPMNSKSENEARKRAQIVSNALVDAGAGPFGCEFWGVDAHGHTHPLWAT
jgi:hypothetical protein